MAGSAGMSVDSRNGTATKAAGQSASASGPEQAGASAASSGQRTFVERRQWQRRTREQIIRDVQLALNDGEGLVLDDTSRARGFDPYDTPHAPTRSEVWKRSRRD